MMRICTTLWTIAALLIAAWVLPSAAQEKQSGMPTVSWYGQSFFTVKSAKGTIVAFDPHLIPAFGRQMGIKADFVLMSHLHDDHTQIAAIDNGKDKSIRVIQGLSAAGKGTNWNTIDETVKGIAIRSVPAYHDAAEGMSRGKNTIFLVDIDGWRFCHLGDLGHELSPAQLKKIGEVDVLMIPVGGVYTLNGSEAKKVVEQIKPKEYIFPMHYGTKIFDDLLPIDEFLDEQEKAKIAKSDDNKVTLNRDVQRPRPLIVILESAPKIAPPKNAK
jgi:L-ascorbate metabolism protein UlaG (beta-lactamase superfamily)